MEVIEHNPSQAGGRARATPWLASRLDSWLRRPWFVWAITGVSLVLTLLGWWAAHGRIGALLAPLVGGFGLLATLLLGWSLRASARHTRRAERLAAANDAQSQRRLGWLTAVSGLSPDAILVFVRGDDGLHRLVFTNPAFSDWFGLRPDDLLGLTEDAVAEWLDALDQGHDHSTLLPDGETLVVLAGPPQRVLRRGLRQDDRQRVYYYRDVTRETEVERLKNEFVTTAAHELRTPLASVYGFTELLLDERVDSARRQRTLGIIYRQAGVLNHLVEELLDLARIDSRQGRDFSINRHDLRQLAALAIETVLRPGQPSRVRALLGDEPAWVAVDGTKTQQAVVNLLSNALKFSAEPSPVLLRLSLTDHEGRAGVALQVQDQGIGMTPEQCSQAFERFYRADPSGHVLGAGLGLAIVREVMALQHGIVSLDSHPGEGTTATLWLPLDSAPAADDSGGQAAGLAARGVVASTVTSTPQAQAMPADATS